jgi:hypothetical protein
MKNSTLPICGAKRTKRATPEQRASGDIPRCKKPAGYGTDHLGNGKCKFHGGCSQFKGGPQNPNYKHGLNAEFRTTEEWEAFVEWRDHGGIKSAEVPEELEFLIWRCLRRLIDNSNLAPAVEADVIGKLTDALLKAQKYRGEEKTPDLNVNLHAREEIIGRLAGIAARRRESGSPGGPDGGAGG